MGQHTDLLALGVLLCLCQISGEVSTGRHDVHMDPLKGLTYAKTATNVIPDYPGTVCDSQIPVNERICTCAYTQATSELQVICMDKGLEEIPEEIPTETRHLDLAVNNIREIKRGPLNHLVNLKSLFLMVNHISEIETNAFRNLRSLTELQLDGNRLTQIPANAFNHLHEVNSIYLTDNPIKIISENAFKLLRKLNTLILRDTNLTCTCACNALYLREWAGEKGLELTDLRCADKPGKPLLSDVPDAEFNCCPSDPPQQECLTCTNEESVEDCFENGNITECEDICFAYRDFTTGSISSGCQQVDSCLNAAARSSELCNDGKDCYWCCAGSHCAKESAYEDFLYTNQYTMRFTMKRPYHEDLNDSDSEQFQQLQEECQLQLDLSFAAVKGEHTSFVTGFSPGSINVTGTITSILGAESDIASVRDGLHDILLDTNSPAAELQIDPKSIEIGSPFLCNRETTLSFSRGDIEWPTSRRGKEVTMPCPADPTTQARAKRFCVGAMAQWEDPDLSECPVFGERLAELEDLTEVPITQGSVSQVCHELHQLTRDTMTFDPTEVELVSLVVQNVISSTVFLNGFNGRELLDSISNMIRVPSLVLGSAQSQYGSVNRLTTQMEQFGQRFDESNLIDEEIIEVKELGIAVGALSSYLDKEVTFQASVRDGIKIEVSTNDVPSSYSNSPASIVLPPSIFNEIPNGESPNVQFTVYHFPTLFEVMVNASRKENSTHNERMKINSRVLSVSFGNVNVNNTADPIKITLSHDVKDATEPQCMFWSFQENGWSQAGCEVHDFVAGSHTVCHCDHLTNFALIMDIYGQGQELSEGHQLALSILSYIGMTLSILGLSITLATYLAFRNLRRDKPARILINLCCALLALCISFVLNTQPNIIKNDVACKMLAGMLHYFTLASLCWMGVEAFYMYLALVKVFQTYFTHFMAKCSLVGWGIPSGIVLITYAVSPNNYVYMENICWLERKAFYGAFLAPVSAILVFNGIVFGMVMYQLRQISKKPEPAMNKKSSLLLHLKGTMSIMSLLGLTWLFAFFGIGGAGVVFNYLFVIFNSAQGLFIFLFYCVFKKDVQLAWMAVVRTRSKTVPDSGSTSRVPTGMTRSTKVAVGPLVVQAAVETSSDHQTSALTKAVAVAPPSQVQSRIPPSEPRSVW